MVLNGHTQTTAGLGPRAKDSRATSPRSAPCSFTAQAADFAALIFAPLIFLIESLLDVIGGYVITIGIQASNVTGPQVQSLFVPADAYLMGCAFALDFSVVNTGSRCQVDVSSDDEVKSVSGTPSGVQGGILAAMRTSFDFTNQMFQGAFNQFMILPRIWSPTGRKYSVEAAHSNGSVQGFVSFHFLPEGG